jgi:hypothetical protein
MMRAVAIICMLVAATANFIAVQHPYQDAAKAVLTLSLKGGGISLAAAGWLSRSIGTVAADVGRQELCWPGAGAANPQRGGCGLSAT